VKFFFALAAGALIGDTMVHILAEAYTNEHSNPSYVALIFICSILGFLILERIF